MKYKALMLDVDGTTVPNKEDGLPSKKVTDAIKKAAKILHVGLVTGRPYFGAKDIITKLELSGPSIVSGGAQVIDVASNKVLAEQTVEHKDLVEIHNHFPSYTMLVTDGHIDVKFSPTHGLKKILDAGIQGIPSKEAEHIIKTVSYLPNLVFHTVPSWSTGNVDVLINHVSATKLHGIVEVAKILGIETHEIIGVGDGGNDMPLLMACGLKIAMGNAHDGLKAIADYVAPTVDEDGVAHVIEKFILKN